MMANTAVAGLDPRNSESAGCKHGQGRAVPRGPRVEIGQRTQLERGVSIAHEERVDDIGSHRIGDFEEMKCLASKGEHDQPNYTDFGV